MASLVNVKNSANACGDGTHANDHHGKSTNLSVFLFRPMFIAENYIKQLIREKTMQALHEYYGKIGVESERRFRVEIIAVVALLL